MNFAILATGNIAGNMARTVKEMDGINRYAVASRNQKNAEAFAEKWGFEKSYGSYEEMLADPNVDLVYVCTPHSHHYKYAEMCIEHGKNVLVEKAFTVSARQAEELIGLAREKNVLLAEAMWTRYMPSAKMLEEIISAGTIGDIISLTANLGYRIENVERLVRPELAGGALLDLGVYTINFALMSIKSEVKKVTTEAVMTDTGVDLSNSITLSFENGAMAVLHSTMAARTDRMGVIYGTEGYIEVVNINNCEEIRVYNTDGVKLFTKIPPAQITGFEYEVSACVKAIESGNTECEDMPHSEILRVMRLMDEIRAVWGMKFPCE